MEENNKKQAIETLKNALDKIENKEFKINFFVLDTKGNPSGAIAYIYDTAYTLYELGYNVQMLHQ
jgi:hypothetical protein